ncbi:signal recognition particle-docking protein FtsY [Neisseriaceae bacterium PsAf]|nr:signal recognition particle-docking protein FtsY [Neisseriaceae bacterium PsAf]
MFGIFKKKSDQSSKKQEDEKLKHEQESSSDVQKTFDELNIEIDTPDDNKLDTDFFIDKLNPVVETPEKIKPIEKNEPNQEIIKEEPSTTDTTNHKELETELHIDNSEKLSSEEELLATEFSKPATKDKPPVKKPEKDTVKKDSWAFRLKKGLSKSRDKFNKSMASIVGGGQINEELCEDLETVLLTSDMGIEATEFLLKEVRDRVSFKGLKDANELRGALKEALFDLIKPLEEPLEITDDRPYVIMMVGVNGAGKTTTIGKLAHHFQNDNKSVILAAGDTFRAAAREQLLAWGERNNVAVIAQDKGDSAAVCYDTLEAAKARHKDIVLADTAGRLPTQLNLMEEIKKVKRVIQKSLPNAPHEIILVLDANIGQNTINQVIAFDEALELTGLIITKLDGTAKGGMIAALAKNRPIPIRYIGVGESIEDLKPFKAQEFVDAFFDD